MFRIWGKVMKNSRFLHDKVVEIDDRSMSKSDKIDMAIDECCMTFDLQKPMWFDKNTKELRQFSRTSFHGDQFIEAVDFDYFEIEIIEEDKEI